MKIQTDYFVIIIGIIVAMLLFTSDTGGFWVTDEFSYMLTLDSLYKTGSLNIWNGNDEIISHEMILPSCIYLNVGDSYFIYGIPAPLYAFIGLPFYKFFGVKAILFMNIFFHLTSSITLFYLAYFLLEDKKQSFLVFLSYVFATYTLQYTRLSIPHMVGVFLVLFSTLLFVYFHKFNRDSKLLFYSGFFMGISLGVRYPNIVFIAVSLFFAYRLYSLGIFSRYFIGVALSVFFVLAINQIYYGLFLVSGYGMLGNLLVTKLKTITFLSIGLIFLGIINKKLQKSGFSMGRRIKILVIILFLIILVKPILLNSIIYRLGLFYAKIFDLTSLDANAYPTPLKEKKALFQSTPFLILGFVAFLKKRKNINFDMILFISCLAFSQILFYSIGTSAVGGLDESYGIRYFLEAVPFLVILTFISLSEFRLYWRKRHTYIFIFLFISTTCFLLLDENLIYTENHSLRLIPTLLSLGLLGEYLRSYGGKSISVIFLIFLSISIAFSSVIAYSDTQLLNNGKLHTEKIAFALDKIILNDSVVVLIKQTTTPHLIRLKLEKDKLRLIFPYSDDFLDTKELIEFYSQRNKTIYIHNPLWLTSDYQLERLREIEKELDYHKIIWMNVSRIK